MKKGGTPMRLGRGRFEGDPAKSLQAPAQNSTRENDLREKGVRGSRETKDTSDNRKMDLRKISTP